MTSSRTVRYLLRYTALAYIFVLLLVPVVLILWRTFAPGLHQFYDWVSTPAAVSALNLSLLVVAIVVPLNVVFGIPTALVLARNRFRGKGVLQAVIDLPFAVSPVVAGLCLVLLFGAHGWFAELLAEHDVKILFARPGIVLATLFITFPFVVRELLPLMQQQGADEELAARSLGAGAWRLFFRITLPNIKWGLLYGVLLCTARAMGEFGAVSVVSGHIRGLTNTLPLHIEILYNEFDTVAAFAAASLLSGMALVTLVLKFWLESRHGDALASSHRKH